MPADECQYCGCDLDARPPRSETGYLYAIECRRCPPGSRRTHMVSRPAPAESLTCPDCGATLAPPESDPSVLVIKELTYDVCPECGERCGVSAVRKLRDDASGAI